MAIAPQPGFSPTPCPTCRNPVDVKSRHVVVRGSAVRVYCSERCKTERIELGPAHRPHEVRPQARRPVALLGAAVAGTTLAGALLLWSTGSRDLAAAALGPVERAGLLPAGKAATPAVPVEDPAKANEERWIADLARAAWIHPLAGPVRRMPVRDSRVFGAERPGDRPGECGSGHCGVDIGGETWGEPVMAVADGVVARVQRDPNPNRGGLYVRLAHRDGGLFTQYFHLAAIPTHLRVGDQVRMGEVIGLLGDTGVHHSSAHLHFTISVQPDKTQPEQYIDPEVLIALWPLKVLPGPGEPAAIAVGKPGAIRGPFASRRRPKPRSTPSKRRATASGPAVSEAGDSVDPMPPEIAEAPAAAASAPPVAEMPAIGFGRAAAPP